MTWVLARKSRTSICCQGRSVLEKWAPSGVKNVCRRYGSKLRACCLTKYIFLTTKRSAKLWSCLYSFYHILFCLQCIFLQIQAKFKIIQELIAKPPWIRLKKWMICLKLLSSCDVLDMWLTWRLKASAVDAESFVAVLDSCNQLEHKLSVTQSDGLNPFNQSSWAEINGTISLGQFWASQTVAVQVCLMLLKLGSRCLTG